MTKVSRRTLARFLDNISAEILVNDLIEVLLGIKLLDTLRLLLGFLKNLFEINVNNLRLYFIAFKVDHRLLCEYTILLKGVACLLKLRLCFLGH